MPEPRNSPGEMKLSEQDVALVLERAARIDAATAGLSVSEVTSAAHEAGISEKAVLQAVEELLDSKQRMSPANTAPLADTRGARRQLGLLLGAGALGFLLLVGLVVLAVLRRIVVS